MTQTNNSEPNKQAAVEFLQLVVAGCIEIVSIGEKRSLNEVVALDRVHGVDIDRQPRQSHLIVQLQTDERKETAMSELDDFLTKTLPRQIKAEEAIHNGDPAPRLDMWSTRDPVTLFGAWGPCKSGSEEVTRISRWVASRFSNCTAYRFELVAAGVSGDLAYTVGYEHSSRSVDGGPVELSTLRVTHVYRRESGEWKIVHRHGDLAPLDQSPPAKASTR